MNVTVDSEKIYFYKVSKQKTKKQFAKDCGMTLLSLNNVLKGDSSVRLTTIMKVCKTMNVPLKDLIKN